MKIAITGDTHGNQQIIRKMVSMAPPAEMWLHTGDYSKDANFLEQIAKLPVINVSGNGDLYDKSANPDEIFELEGFNIWLTHGHKYFRHGEVSELAWWSKRLETNIVIYGHTHIPMFKWYGDVLLVNPGSPALPRGGSDPCFAVLNLQQGKKPEIEFITLQENKRTSLFSFDNL